jgi:hypothetical protein
MSLLTDPGEISGVLIHARKMFLRSWTPDKGRTSPRHPAEIRAKSRAASREQSTPGYNTKSKFAKFDPK